MSRSQFESWLKDQRRRPLVMGILNLTPDSFSDGGRLPTIESAVKAAEEMAADGADWIDVGGESTRPGAQPVAPDEQIRRIMPVIAAIRHLPVILSIDTMSAAVAAQALDAGADAVNDISAGEEDAGMFPLVARRRAAIILMHMQGRPATMQARPTYANVTSEVARYLSGRRDAAIAAGIEHYRILLDPGFGFGKTTFHNLCLLRDTAILEALGSPLVVGPSRKNFIGQITGEPRPPDRVIGTAAAIAFAVANGAAVARVHDIKPIAQVVRMIRAILDPENAGGADQSAADIAGQSAGKTAKESVNSDGRAAAGGL